MVNTTTHAIIVCVIINWGHRRAIIIRIKIVIILIGAGSILIRILASDSTDLPRELAARAIRFISNNNSMHLICAPYACNFPLCLLAWTNSTQFIWVIVNLDILD